jgi:hypothetical protein
VNTPPAETSSNLVEPEGVNAATANPPEPAPAGDVRSGGRPANSDQMDDVASRDEVVGPPDQQAAGPGQELSAGEG